MSQSSTPSEATQSEAERIALKKAPQAERDRLAQEEALNDIRAEQQMIEGAVDTDASVRRMEEVRRGES